MEKWSNEDWDRALDKVHRFFEKQCPGAKCEVWLVGSAMNKTDYEDWNSSHCHHVFPPFYCSKTAEAFMRSL